MLMHRHVCAGNSEYERVIDVNRFTRKVKIHSYRVVCVYYGILMKA